MSRTRIPDAVLEAAHARAAARLARDWAEADRLKEEIEAAGWKIVDRGTDFALSPAKPPDVAEDDRIRFGSSSSVPSRLADPAVGPATVVLVLTDAASPLRRTLTALDETAPPDTSLVIVVDGRAAAGLPELDEVERRTAGQDIRLRTEIAHTSERLGPAAALNIGIRRASGPVVVVLDPAVELGGDVVTPLVRALEDRAVAITGGWGSVTSDRRHFEDAPPGDVDVVSGALMAFRRADAAERGPVDERLRTEFYTAICWSLALRDGGSGGPHRRAVALADVPAIKEEAASVAAPQDRARSRDLKRDFYTYLDRFGSRGDLFGGSGPAPHRQDVP